MTATCAGVASILLRAPRSDPEHGGSRVADRTLSSLYRFRFVFRLFSTVYSIRRLTDYGSIRKSEPCQEEEEEEDLRPTFLLCKSSLLIHEYSRFCVS